MNEYDKRIETMSCKIDNIEEKLNQFDKKLDVFLTEYKETNRFKRNECESHFKNIFVQHEQVPSIVRDAISQAKKERIEDIKNNSTIMKNIFDIIKVILPVFAVIIAYMIGG